MKNRRKLFVFAAIVPILILLAFMWKPLLTLNTGTQIELETVPVDPRDLLYGDYVSLRFEIEEVDKRNIAPSLQKKLSGGFFGRTIAYAVLEKTDGNTYTLQAVTDKRPKDGIWLKGRLNSFSSIGFNRGTVYYADFLPDRFYVPENTGMRLEKLSREGKLVAVLKVRKGYAVLEDIREKE